MDHHREGNVTPLRRRTAATSKRAFDRDGELIGTVEAVWVRADQPVTWVAVRTGFFGAKVRVAPAARAVHATGDITISVSRQLVTDAPRVGPLPLATAETARLCAYYGITHSDQEV